MRSLDTYNNKKRKEKSMTVMQTINFCQRLLVNNRDAARGGAGGAAAPPDFGRSVNPISTRGG